MSLGSKGTTTRPNKRRRGSLKSGFTGTAGFAYTSHNKLLHLLAGKVSPYLMVPVGLGGLLVVAGEDDTGISGNGALICLTRLV